MSAERPGARLRTRFDFGELLDTIGHDVRAALSVTSGAASELGSADYGSLTDTQRQLLGIIQRGNTRLGRLAGNLLVLSELWEGTSSPRPMRLDLRALLSQCVDELRRQDAAGRTAWLLELPEAPLYVSADPAHLALALSNVLGTAAAVARTRVAVRLWDSDGQARLSVDDDGPARPPSPQKGAKRVSSTDLAIAVADDLLRIAEGELAIETPLDAKGGCRVALSLPTVAS